jgi:hypothetical protein
LPKLWQVKNPRKSGQSFFKNRKNKFQELHGVALNVSFFMGDADVTQYNATRAVFPQAIVLMCLFHVFKNCRDQIRHLPTQLYIETMMDIHKIHFAEDQATAEAFLAITFQKWLNIEALVEFAGYFETQWVQSPFKNRCQYHTPPAFAATNNPAESFNASIKRDYTIRERLKIPAFIKVCI